MKEECAMRRTGTQRWITIWTLVLMASAAVGTTAAYASHRWSCWQYANYYVRWYNGATGDYWNIFEEETKSDSNSWHKYTDMYLPAVSSSGTTDHINAYSGYYGANGWLGIAEIRRYSGCTIQEGRARLNLSYLQSGYSRTAKKHVACQEVGHLLGLEHNRGSNSTCMNDTILTAPYPNSHDRSLVNSIY